MRSSFNLWRDLIRAVEGITAPDTRRNFTLAGVIRTLDGRELLVFEIESAPRAVMIDGNGFLHRIGDTTRQFSEQAINAIKDVGIVPTRHGVDG